MEILPLDVLYSWVYTTPDVEDATHDVVVFGGFVQEQLRIGDLLLEKIQGGMSPFCIQLDLGPQVLVPAFGFLIIDQAKQVLLIKISAQKFIAERLVKDMIALFCFVP